MSKKNSKTNEVVAVSLQELGNALPELKETIEINLGALEEILEPTAELFAATDLIKATRDEAYSLKEYRKSLIQKAKGFMAQRKSYLSTSEQLEGEIEDEILKVREAYENSDLVRTHYENKSFMGSKAGWELRKKVDALILAEGNKRAALLIARQEAVDVILRDAVANLQATEKEIEAVNQRAIAKFEEAKALEIQCGLVAA
jgi:hypothetical protein